MAKTTKPQTVRLPITDIELMKALGEKAGIGGASSYARLVLETHCIRIRRGKRIYPETDVSRET